MARIPSADELGIREITGSAGSINAPRISPETSTYGLDSSKIALDEEIKRLDAKELADAKVQFQLAQISAYEKYNNDSEIDTIPERHDAEITDQLGKAASNITNPDLREAFITESSVSAEQAKVNMRDKVQARKNDREIGYMSNAFEEIVKGTVSMENGAQGLSTGSQIIQGVQAIQIAAQSMVKRNVISEQQAQEIVRKAQDKMAIGKLMSMDPKEQILALKEDWVKNIDPATRKRLKDEATNQAENEEAHANAMEIKDMSLSEGLSFIENKYSGNDSMYQKVRVRFMQMKSDQKESIQESQSDFYNDYFYDVAQGSMKVSDIPDLRGAELSDMQIRALYEAEAKAARRKSGELIKDYSDPEVVNQLDTFIAQGNLTEARGYYSEHFHQLSGGPRGDIHYYRSQIAPRTANTQEAKALRTPRDLLKDFQKKHSKLNAEESGQIWDRLQHKVNAYFDSNQKNPNNQQINEWIKEEYWNVRRSINWWPDEEKFVYQLSADRRMKYDSNVSAIQSLTGMSRKSAAASWSGYTQEQYDMLDQYLSNLNVIRRRYPNDSDSQIWMRIKIAVGEPGNAD